MPTFKYDKLVRDNIWRWHEECGHTVHGHKLTGKKLIDVLRKKLLEEAAEVNEAISKEELLEELADVQQVLDDARRCMGVTAKELHNIQQAKFAKKGGFKKGCYIDSVTIPDENDKWAAYCRAQPHKCPEMRTISSHGTQPVSIAQIVQLADLLGAMGSIDRATLLPGGRNETDSHHSFSLALVCFDVCSKYCPDLDINKVIKMALVHDLLEIFTGDEDTLHMDEQALQSKHEREQGAMSEFNGAFEAYPELVALLSGYERLDTPEAATVYVLDKACATWTHHHDDGNHLRGKRQIRDPADLQGWRDRQHKKMVQRLHAQPPNVIFEIFEQSFKYLAEEQL